MSSIVSCIYFLLRYISPIKELTIIKGTSQWNLVYLSCCVTTTSNFNACFHPFKTPTPLSNQCSLSFSSVQSLSHVRLFVTPWIPARQASLSITSSWSLLKLMPIELVMPSNHCILCHPLLLLCSIFPSIRVFSKESTQHEVAKVLEFQLQHQSFQWTPRTDLL